MLAKEREKAMLAEANKASGNIIGRMDALVKAISCLANPARGGDQS